MLEIREMKRREVEKAKWNGKKDEQAANAKHRVLQE